MSRRVKKMVWEEPPSKTVEKATMGRTQLFIEGLKRRPGKWAVYQRDMSYYPGGYRTAYPKVEWTMRATEKGITVYARWKGRKVA